MRDVPSDWTTRTGRLRLRLGILEDEIPDDVVADFELGRAFAPEPLLAWFRAVLARIEALPEFSAVPMNPEVVGLGAQRDEAEVQVLLCSRASLDDLFEMEGALGAHVLSTAGADPFGEESPSAREYRIVVVCDRDEFVERIADLARDDDTPERYLDEYLCAWANTLFHELEHVRLFAQNAALARPCDVESLADAGAFAHDLFDCSSGYGIRPLATEGGVAWAEDCDEAREMMERHVEESGRALMARLLHGDCAPHKLLEAFAVEQEINEILSAPEGLRP